jgi:hypothetical protein
MGSVSLKNKSKSGNLTAPGDVDPGAMIPLMTTTLGSAAASVTFSAIPQNYEHLQVRIWGWNNSGSDRSLAIYYNSDAGINYVNHYLQGTGSAASSGAQTGRGQTFILDSNSGQTGFNGDVNKASVFIIDILDYKNTNKNKTIRALGGWDGNGTGVVGLGSSLWLSTAAISTLTFFLPYSTNIGAGSTFALYGIKRAGA